MPTSHVGGAWAADEQHFSPLAGLIVHEIECARTRGSRPDMLMSRISFDILGRIAFGEFDIQVEVLRPGRTIELVEATVIIAGRPTVSARAWLTTAQDTAAVSGGEPDSLTSPDQLASWSIDSVWPGGYIESIDVRQVGTPEQGRATAWIRSAVDLVAGEDASTLASYVALVDTANGIGVRQDPTKWMFPNLDLTIHLYRQPEGPWTGLDTSVTFGGTGQGLTRTVLHDTRGPVGVAEQILTVRPQPV
ncbi:thioesterase family protein [Aldersonia kunmingensis]|uniref:thioesterase family protein n=1 Tax=Aldersonia kunmingensis TaxID=408066 RepID=UPI001FE1811B|nr:thioesterase family protein [Aldersonia kunmingensis]